MRIGRRRLFRVAAAVRRNLPPTIGTDDVYNQHDGQTSSSSH